MTQKRKRSRSKNNISVEGSAASRRDDAPSTFASNPDIPISIVRFPKPKWLTAYENRFQHRSVGCERSIDAQALEDSGIGHILRRRGWTELCVCGVPAAVELVKEFYSCVHKDDRFEADEDILVSKVRGKLVTISPQIIAKFLKISRDFRAQLPGDGDFEFPSNDVIAAELYGDVHSKWDEKKNCIAQGHMSEKYRILNILFSYNIHPCKHWNTLDIQRARILYAIGTGIPIDLPMFIFRVIRNAFGSKSLKETLPFGSLLTRLIEREGVIPGRNEDVVKPKCELNQTTISKSRGHSARIKSNSSNIGRNKIGERDPMVSMGDGRSDSEAMNDHEDTMATILDNIQNLQKQISDHEEKMRKEFSSLKEEIGAQFKAMEQRVLINTKNRQSNECMRASGLTDKVANGGTNQP